MAMATHCDEPDGGGGDRIRRLLIQQEDNTINIPNDIVIEILLRLPAKSLVRLRWTCKYLFDSITRNPDFANMHKHHCSIITTNHDDMFNIISPSVLSTTISYGLGDHYEISQCYLNYNDTTRVANVSNEVSIALPFYYPLGCRPEIIGSCNGLILLYERCLGDSLCIWNPCTKEYKVLPHSLRNRYVCMEEGYANYGFGYDHTNDEYKLVRNSYYHLFSPNDLELYSDVQVYTLGTNSWRRIGFNPYRLHTYRLLQGVFVNGALYWMDYLDKNVISFDFVTEKFRHVSATPNCTTANHLCYGPTIHVFEGSVCVVMINENENHTYGYGSEIWVMKDYAVNNNESLWVKLSIPNPHHMWLLKYTRNGEILMLKKKRNLVLYDQKNNDAKELGTFSKKFSYHVADVVYTESLISLNSGIYTGQEQRKNDDNNNNKNKKK